VGRGELAPRSGIQDQAVVASGGGAESPAAADATAVLTTGVP
jgi:hypothetical protein